MLITDVVILGIINMERPVSEIIFKAFLRVKLYLDSAFELIK